MLGFFGWGAVVQAIKNVIQVKATKTACFFMEMSEKLLMFENLLSNDSGTICHEWLYVVKKMKKRTYYG